MANFSICPVCQKERRIRGTRANPLMTQHNRWNGKAMVLCPGSGKSPQSKSGVASVVFRNPG